MVVSCIYPIVMPKKTEIFSIFKETIRVRKLKILPHYIIFNIEVIMGNRAGVKSIDWRKVW